MTTILTPTMPARLVKNPYRVQQWLTSQRRVHPLKPEGQKLLKRITDYLWEIAQDARTQDEHEDFTAGLYILGAIRKGWASPVLAAYYYAFGVHPYKFKRYRLERHARMEWELAKLTPPQAKRKIANTIPTPQTAKKKPPQLEHSIRKHQKNDRALRGTHA